VAGVLEELAFDLSMQALSRQEHSLEDLRTRAGTLLAASSVVSSFLGATALNRGGRDGFQGWR